MQKRKNCSEVCAHHCAQLSYTTQHRAVLIIFSLLLHTSTRAQMLSIGGEGDMTVWRIRMKIIVTALCTEHLHIPKNIVCQL